MDKKIILIFISFLLILGLSIIVNNYIISKNDPCNLKLKGFGSCQMKYFGFEYDSLSNKCIEKDISGCDAQIPFHDKIICENNCIK